MGGRQSKGRTARWALLVVVTTMLGGGLGACAESSGRGPNAADPSDSRDEPSLAQDGRLRVTAKDAASHGLPPIGFSALWGEGGWSGSVFPESGVYATLSGPPGGPQLFMVRGYSGMQAQHSAIPRLVKRLDLPKPLKLGPPTKVRLARADRPAMGLLTGESVGKTQWCAVLVEPDENKLEGLLLLIGTGASPLDETDCTMVTSHPAIAPLVASFRLE